MKITKSWIKWAKPRAAHEVEIKTTCNGCPAGQNGPSHWPAYVQISLNEFDQEKQLVITCTPDEAEFFANQILNQVKRAKQQ